MADELMAAPRDASFARYPGRGGKYHAVVERDGHRVGACGVSLLYLECEEPAAGLLPSEKCTRPACRNLFDAALSTKDTLE